MDGINGMSDEDFMKAFASMENNGFTESEEEVTEGEEVTQESTEQTDHVEYDESVEQSDDDTTDDVDYAQQGETVDDTSEEDEPEEEGEDSETKTEEEVPDFSSILEPFDVNGSAFKVQNIDEARQLMQMGLRYSQERNQLNQHMKVIKTLEANKLLDEQTLNRLIDLNNGDPQAIAHLLQQSQLDPMDLDTDVQYTPRQHAVSDTRIMLDNVLDSIQHTTGYQRTVDVIGNRWDAQSRNEMTTNPQLITTLNQHMMDGTYDKVSEAVSRARMFGQLHGMSDLDAYVAMGKQMFSNEPQQVQQPVATTNPHQQQAVNKQRRQAAPAQGGRNTTKVNTAPDINRMSDEDFMKYFNQQQQM